MIVFRCALLATLLGITTGTMADLADIPAGKYGLDKSHAYISFTYSHLGFSTPHVGFDAFDVSLDLDTEDPESSTVSVNVDATSITSRVAEFDEHLNGDKFFDTANHPQITFESTSIKNNGDDSYDVVGELTIKGISKTVTLATTINKAANHPMKKIPTIGLSGEATVNRSEWGLSYAVPMVGDEVTIYVTAELPLANADE